jgi:hypothetical protein
LRQIERELKTAKHCAVYEEELSRIWPDGNQRQPKVARFAEDHGFRPSFIGTAYAPFSIKSPASATSNRSALIQPQCYNKAGHFSARHGADAKLVK